MRAGGGWTLLPSHSVRAAEGAGWHWHCSRRAEGDSGQKRKSKLLPPPESPRYICVATASNAALCQCFLPPPPLQKLPRPRSRPDITSVTVYDPEGGVELSLNPVPILTIIHGNVYTVYCVPTPRPRHRRRTQPPPPALPGGTTDVRQIFKAVYGVLSSYFNTNVSCFIFGEPHSGSNINVFIIVCRGDP